MFARRGGGGEASSRPAVREGRSSRQLTAGGGGRLPDECVVGGRPPAKRAAAGNPITWHDHRSVEHAATVRHVGKSVTEKPTGPLEAKIFAPAGGPGPGPGAAEEPWEGEGEEEAPVEMLQRLKAENAQRGGQVGAGNFVRVNCNKRRFGRRKFLNKAPRFKKHKKWSKAKGKAEEEEGEGADQALVFSAVDVPLPAAVDGAAAAPAPGRPGSAAPEGEGGAAAPGPPRALAAPAGRATPAGSPAGFRGAAAAAAAPLSDEFLRQALAGVFGHAGFRAGQLEIVKKVLRGESLLAVMPTGAGKSLCYQLPALLMHRQAPVLIVSPLLALMSDQLANLPPGMAGAMLGGKQSREAYRRTMARLEAGELNVLYMSPEQLASTRVVALLRRLPPAPFACIDEAHCVSEWSHNFRPAYFRLAGILREQLGIGSLLGLTATATLPTVTSICSILGIAEENTVRASSIRDNLRLYVQHVENHGKAQYAALKLFSASGLLARCKSVIVYCNFKSETEQIASLLMSNHVTAKAYHSEKHKDEKEHIYRLFKRGKLRVVVATVAFGMGIDMQDIDGIVHYGMPRSPEEYVQEAGRAGRDGREAVCVTLLMEDAFLRLKSLSFSDGVDEYNVQKLLAKLFDAKHRISQGEGAPPVGILSTAFTSSEMDMREGVLETVLTFLDQDQDQGAGGGDGPYIRLQEPLLGQKCFITFYSKSPQELAKQSSFVATLLQVQPRPKTRKGEYIVTIEALLKARPVTLAALREEMQALQAKRAMHCELRDAALCYEVVATPLSVRALAKQIAGRLNAVEQRQVSRLDALRAAMEADASGAVAEASVRAKLADYFEHQRQDFPLRDLDAKALQYLQNDVAALVRAYRLDRDGPRMTPRAVARIFHGIGSPAFPVSSWRRCPQWGHNAEADFRHIMALARKVYSA